MTTSRQDSVRRASERRPATADARPATADVRAGAIDDAFFRHIVLGMRNGVLAVRRDGTLALINDEAYRVFGITPDAEDLGKPLATVLSAHPELVRMLAGVFDLHHLPTRVEMRLRPSGRVIGYTVAMVRNDAGTVLGATMFFRDLTRVEQLEERERLRDRLAAVGEMAAAIAHEVKNPLAGIEVMAGLLRRKVTESPEAQKVLTDIISEAKMANAIVQEVLEFVRPIRLQVEPTIVADAVHAAILLADTQTGRGQVRVDVEIARTLQIQADQHQVAQVFTNLLMNAYDALGGTGRIAVTAERVWLDDGGEGRDAVLVEFADDGPGIPQDVADKIFDPFFTTKAHGSGLGLAIVRKIVDAHDGRIDLRTAPGQGVTIRITLPVTGTDDAQ